MRSSILRKHATFSSVVLAAPLCSVPRRANTASGWNSTGRVIRALPTLTASAFGTISTSTTGCGSRVQVVLESSGRSEMSYLARPVHLVSSWPPVRQRSAQQGGSPIRRRGPRRAPISIFAPAPPACCWPSGGLETDTSVSKPRSRSSISSVSCPACLEYWRAPSEGPPAPFPTPPEHAPIAFSPSRPSRKYWASAVVGEHATVLDVRVVPIATGAAASMSSGTPSYRARCSGSDRTSDHRPGSDQLRATSSRVPLSSRNDRECRSVPPGAPDPGHLPGLEPEIRSIPCRRKAVTICLGDRRSPLSSGPESG